MSLAEIISRKQVLITAGAATIGTGIWFYHEKSYESGTYFLLSLLSLVVSIVTRKVSPQSNIYFDRYKLALEEIERQFKLLRPYTALDQLESFNSKLEIQYLNDHNKNLLLSKFHFLKGQILLETKEDKSAGFEELIKAYRLDDGSAYIQERALTSLFHLKEFSEAQELCEKILDADPYNARAWVIRVLTKHNGSIDLVPENVVQKLDFKFILSTFLIKIKDFKYVEYLIQKERENDIVNIEIDNSNFRYYLHLALFYYNSYFSRFIFYVDPEKNVKSTNNPEVIEINILLKRIVGKLGKTELFVHNQYYQQAFVFFNFTEFYLSKEKDPILKNYEIIQSGFKYVTDPMIVHLAVNLAHINESEKLLTICDSIEFSEILDLKLVKAEYHLKIGKTDEALESYKAYLDCVETIDLRCAKLSLLVIDTSYTLKNNPLIFVENLIQKKQFSTENHKNLIKAYALRFYVDSAIEAYDILEPILERYADFDREEKLAICSILATIQRNEECESYLRSIVDIDVESPELKFYIQILQKLKKNHEEILMYLGKWNDHYNVDPQFLSWEMHLKYIQGDMSRIEFLAQKGKLSFPKNVFFLINLCIALYRQEKEGQLRKIKLEIADYDIPYQSAFELASIYFQIGENEFATELAFQQLKKHPNNVVVKQSYFTLLTLGNRERSEKQPQIVEKDCTVRVLVGEETKLIHINEEILTTNEIAEKFLGKNIDGIIRFEEPLTGSVSEYKIVQIMDKYTGMVAEISEDFKQSTKIEGYSIISVETPKGDIKGFSKKLRETFGYEGEKTHLRIQDAFSKYELGKLSFSELLIQVDETNPIQIYDHLTHYGKWYRIPPLEFVKNVDYSKIEEYVIDLTSITALMAFSDELEKPNPSFIVSSFLVEHLKQKIQELENHGDELMTLSIRIERVEPHITGKQEIENRIDWYKSCLIWIEMFCKVEYSTSKLDVISQFADYNPNRWYFNYWIDTVFLANSDKRSLITNDEINFKKFFQQTQPMTSEYFFLSEGISEKRVVQYHLENRYVGVKINAEILKSAYESTKIYERNQIFKNAINALHFNFHGDKNVIYEVVRFLKDLYASTPNRIFNNYVAEAMIFETLKSYPLDLQFSNNFTSFIKSEFELLPIDQIELMKVVIKVFEILNYRDA